MPGHIYKPDVKKGGEKKMEGRIPHGDENCTLDIEEVSFDHPPRLS